MRLIIDITPLLNVDYITGIQVVVRKVIPMLISCNKFEVILLQYKVANNTFTIIDNNDFIKFAGSDQVKWNNPLSDKIFEISQLNNQDIFFDIDAVWISAGRSTLYKQIKKTGTKIAVYIHDVYPVLSTKFVDSNTILTFSMFLGAVLKYSDLILSQTQTTLNETKKLMQLLSIKREIEMQYTWLGCDFTNDNLTIKDVPDKVASAIQSGKYLLQIGSLLPHKNHKLTLDAMDAGLFDKGLNYIIAGRIGWDCKDFEERVAKHPLLNKQLFFLEKVDNDSLKVLYKNAYALAFPSKEEGFGLPAIEAMLSNIPVFAGDIPVLREVCEDFAEYVDVNDYSVFTSKVMRYLNNPSAYDSWKRRIVNYKRITWEDVTSTISNALISHCH